MWDRSGGQELVGRVRSDRFSVRRKRFIWSARRPTPTARGRVDTAGSGSVIRATFYEDILLRILTVVAIGLAIAGWRLAGFGGAELVYFALIIALMFAFNQRGRAPVRTLLQEAAAGDENWRPYASVR